MSDSCVFCRIWAGDMRPGDGEVLFRTEHAMILVPLNPVAEGHVMSVPGIHREDFTKGLVPGGVEAFRLAAHWAGHKGGDFNLIANKGPAATQSVYHTHMHLVPRTREDRLPLPWSRFRERDVDDVADVLRDMWHRPMWLSDAPDFREWARKALDRLQGLDHART